MLYLLPLTLRKRRFSRDSGSLLLLIIEPPHRTDSRFIFVVYKLLLLHDILSSKNLYDTSILYTFSKHFSVLIFSIFLTALTAVENNNFGPQYFFCVGEGLQYFRKDIILQLCRMVYGYCLICSIKINRSTQHEENRTTAFNLKQAAGKRGELTKV